MIFPLIEPLQVYSVTLCKTGSVLSIEAQTAREAALKSVISCDLGCYNVSVTDITGKTSWFQICITPTYEVTQFETAP